MPSPACPTCLNLQIAAMTVAAAFPSLMETIHTGDWKISSCAAINGYPCTSTPVHQCRGFHRVTPGQAGVDHMTNEMTMTNAVIECILSRSASATRQYAPVPLATAMNYAVRSQAWVRRR